MQASLAILMCDEETGCTEYIDDYYEQGATNWRELMGAWQFNPNKSRDEAFCPEHATTAERSTTP